MSFAADFSIIRYAQCWEDADVLVAGLDTAPGARILSICSAGDNALALLVRDPAEVVAVDLSPAQIACLHLRIAAYRALSHQELLELIGSRPSTRRLALYRRCRDDGGLHTDAVAFWDARPAEIERGIGAIGKFEGYFETFRRRVLPLVHSRSHVEALLQPRTAEARESFYESTWNTWRWRAVFRIFFSRFMMGRLGRDPSFFAHVDGPVATRILARARHALVTLDPSRNPYLHWILTGTHGAQLPLALREEHFETIRSRLERITVVHGPIECAVESALDRSSSPFDAFNLSDIFEYMSPADSETLLRRLVDAAAPGARLLYWNMLAPRACPPALADRVEPMQELAERLHHEDQAFFYSRLVIERVRGGGRS